MKKILLVLFLIVIQTSFVNAFSLDSTLNFHINTTPHSDLLYKEWEGTFGFVWPNFEILVGKTRYIWGAGSDSSLSLSKYSPSLPSISYRFKLNNIYNITIPEIRYMHFLSMLENDTNRWLFGHRLEMDILPNLQFGAWELMLCSEEVFWGYYVPVPLIPLYAKQHIAYKLSDGIYDYNSNVMLGFDFKYSWDDSNDIYAEVLIDDFPQRAIYNNPRKIGGLVGMRKQLFSNLGVWTEYVRINNFVYTHKNPLNRYLYYAKPFGHWLGMDGDLWTLGTKYDFDQKNSLTLQFNRIQKGEGDYDDNWEQDYGRNYEFLTGVIERFNELAIGITHDFDDNICLSSGVTFGFNQNAEHILNNDRGYFKLNFGLDLSFDYKLSLGY